MREDRGNSEAIIFSNATIVAFRFSADYYLIALYFSVPLRSWRRAVETA